MTLLDLINRVSQKLEENARYYPTSEIILSGINPAQRLISILKTRLQRRVIYTFSAENLTVDLRQIAPRLWNIQRILVGNMTDDTPAQSAGGQEYRPLTAMTLEQLAWKRNWITHRGRVRRYWRWGDHHLGIYKRPVVATTVTIIFDALPLAFTTNDEFATPSPSSELPVIAHPMIADVAAALLVMKEGVGETEKAEQALQQIFGQELTKGLRRTLRQVREAEQLREVSNA